MRPEPQRNAFTLVCKGHAELEAAIGMLHSLNFDMKSVSVVGRDVPGGQEVVGCYLTGEHFRYRGPLGAFWDGLWELLDGSGLFWLPDFGRILIAGPFAGWIVASLENSFMFDGLTVVGSAIYRIGIPREEIVRYEASLKAGALLLVVHGSAATVEIARRLLAQHKRIEKNF
jgi:hypothetical protein